MSLCASPVTWVSGLMGRGFGFLNQARAAAGNVALLHHAVSVPLETDQLMFALGRFNLANQSSKLLQSHATESA